MSQLNYKPDFNDAQENQYDPLPAGDYIVVIESSEMCDTKSGEGQYLKLGYQVIDGKFKGRKLFENLNLVNKNQQAEQIARRALNAICAAVDLPHVDDSAQLHNIPLSIKVGTRNSDDYGPQNVIKQHRGIGKNAETPQGQNSAEPTPAPAKGGKKQHPWEK